MTVAVTGASGFVGQHLVRQLAEQNMTVRRIVRTGAGADDFAVGDLAAASDLHQAVGGCDCVFHLANRAHVMHEAASDPEAEYDRVNVAATLNLAEAAARKGVRRFVYLSSIKVNGETAPTSRPFAPGCDPQPADAYGRSKLKAERGLMELSKRSGLEVVIIRPPLVYGPGVKANFLSLLALAHRNSPLLRLFGKATNRRAMIYVGTLCEALIRSISNPAVAGGVFTVRDPVELDLRGLVKHLLGAFGHGQQLLPVPVRLLRSAGRATGQTGKISRLLDELSVDPSLLFRQLDWRPEREDGLEQTAGWFASLQYRNQSEIGLKI